MSAPYDYNFINAYNSSYDPSTVHCKNTNLTRYFERYLYQKLFSVFKWEAPESWNMDYFRYVLYKCGYIAIVNTDAFGVIPQLAGLRGYNVFYAPTNAIIVNPLISGILEPVIDEECTVIKLTPDYCGLSDLISYYANEMSLAGEAAAMNLINSKLAFIAAARNRAMAETIKKGFDQMQSGNPLVVYDEKFKETDRQDLSLLELFTQNLRENFITPEIQSAIRELDNEFDRKIGLYTVNTAKRERLIVDEVNQDSTYCMADGWLKSLQDGCQKTADMFGIEISVDWRYPHETESVDPESVPV